MFGKYTLNYLNQNKAFVLKIMTQKAAEYANFKYYVAKLILFLIGRKSLNTLNGIN